MDRRIAMTGKNANEVYYISFPKNLLVFLKYDFTIFMERSIDLCRLYIKTGEYHPEEAAEIRNSISGCHKYVEQNIRGVFEKLVIDCWIEYICRQNEIGVVTLWNNFIPCRNDFEKAVFSRLCEYRHNYAINQWVNLLKIQEYALCKADFVFGASARNPQTASARGNYFDLMFNVTANEMGFDLSGIAENKIFNMGRIPNSPFVMRNISREIIRNVLTDVKYSEDNKFKMKKGIFAADQTAMDAFSAIKSHIPSEDDSIVGTMIKSMVEIPQKVYMPTGFKAVIDLEIDALIESGAVLQRCNRCREYFMRDSNYDYDYCNRVNREGKSCLDIMSEKEGVEEARIGVKKIRIPDSAELTARCDQLYKDMSARVSVDISQRDFTDWYKYLILIRDNVLNQTATMEDFENFVDYSLSITFKQQKSKFIPEESYKDENFQENQFRSFNSNTGNYTPQNNQQQFQPNHQTVQRSLFPNEINTDKRNNIQNDFNANPNTKGVKPFVFERVDKKVTDEHEIQFRPTNSETFRSRPPVTSKVIRASSYGHEPYEMHEQDFRFQSSVTIPYGKENDIYTENKPVEYEKYENNFEEFKTSEILENNNNYNFENDENDEDIKIYDVVKVFEPGRLKKQERVNALKTVAKRLEIPDRKKKVEIEEIQENAAVEKEALPVFEPISLPPDNKKQHVASVYRQQTVQDNFESQTPDSVNKNYKDNIHEQDKAGNLWETSEIKKILEDNNGFKENNENEIQRSTVIPNPILNKAIEQTQELDVKENTDFEGILKGLERKDNFFGEQGSSDDDGTPATHKTKRVMDAIFKPSKPSVFFNINKNNDE